MLGDLKELLINLAAALIGFTANLVIVWLVNSRQLGLIAKVLPLQGVGLGGKGKLHVRVSLDKLPYGSNPDTWRGYSHIGDVKSLILITNKLAKLGVTVDFDYFTEIRHDMTNMLIIGCADRNPLAREVAEDLGKRGIRVVSNGHHAFFCDADGNTYKCAEIEHSFGETKTKIVVQDAAIIYRRKRETGGCITLIGGIHTQGTYAAAQVAMAKEFQERVKKLGTTEFVQFITVTVQKEGEEAGIAINEISWKNHPLHRLDRYSLRHSQ